MSHRWSPRVQAPTDLVRPVPIDPEGRCGPTRGQARGPRWRRTSDGLHVPSSVTDDLVEQRILEQSMRLRGRGVVTGWAALRLMGGGFFDGLARDGATRLPVPVAADGARIRSVGEVVVVRDTVPPDEVVLVRAVRCAQPERAVFDEVRRVGCGEEGTVVIDMAAAAELTSLRRLRRYLAERRWTRDVRLVGGSLDLADEGSRSPPETRFRIVWEVDAGWGRPLTNAVLHDDTGRFLGIPDLLDPVRGVVGEYDGADHRDRERHEADVRREDRFRRAGLEYVAVVGRDLRDRSLVVSRMHAALDRTGHLPRTWVVVDPTGPTLDELLDLRESAR